RPPAFPSGGEGNRLGPRRVGVGHPGVPGKPWLRPSPAARLSSPRPVPQPYQPQPPLAATVKAAADVGPRVVDAADATPLAVAGQEPAGPARHSPAVEDVHGRLARVQRLAAVARLIAVGRRPHGRDAGLAAGVGGAGLDEEDLAAEAAA